MFDHSALKAHPSRQCLQQAFIDSVFTNLLANGLGFFFLVGSFHGQVGHHGLFPILVDHVPTDVRCHRAPGTEALRANPIRKAMASQRGFHVGLNALDFSHGLVVGHRRAVRVAATTNDDGEAVAAVIAKADFLMGATEHFNLHVGQLNVGHLVHGGVDDEQLRGHGALVFRTGKEHAIAGNAEFCRELVAKPVGLPVGQRDFRHGESAAVVEVNGGGNLFHTEVGHPGFDDATDAFVRCSVPLQANGLCDGVGHGNDLCFKAMRCRIRRPCR